MNHKPQLVNAAIPWYTKGVKKNIHFISKCTAMCTEPSQSDTYRLVKVVLIGVAFDKIRHCLD